MSRPICFGTIPAFFAALPERTDVDRLAVGWAVPHGSHVPGFATPGSLLRERAFIADGRTFIHVSCCCGATPNEVAGDLGIPTDWLGPLAAEQSVMIKIQRRLRESIRDPEARELLQVLGLTVAQAMLWRRSDLGPAPMLSGGFASVYEAGEAEAA